MRTAIRVALVLAGVAALAVAYGFLAGVQQIVALWPYPSAYGLGPVFLASIFAAIGAPVIWIGLSGDLAALRPGALNTFVFSALLCGQAVVSALRGSNTPSLLVFPISTGVLAFGSLLVLILVRSEAWRDARMTPWPVRLAFAAFALVLLVVGGLLVAGVDVFPWALDRANRFAYGAIFLGPALYFAYGVARPVWSNAKGQLIGFLAYDLVLFAPYLALWPRTAGDQRLSLAVYLSVLVVSGVLAAWYLLVSPIWRLGRPLGPPSREWRRRVVSEEA